MDSNALLMAVLTPVTAVPIPTTISDAMSPYSIAVTPDSSLRKRLVTSRKFDMEDFLSIVVGSIKPS
jgi:hypothetical protein